ncbi:hypothetical protein BU23DRAFT_81768 [Bimuria novae-zelandiae CBS 107.79]|uniref:Uncharacterized protein n=1 Tax=Bimuria novae-zelandiae CBS 107.79 TaxID=1447943 RepID=A0A6A5VDV8_9PLEO|nr:hypothetical protein BU23DRAFT_81768 [Bimuria novae-zelandiae CBS 107.79]
MGHILALFASYDLRIPAATSQCGRLAHHIHWTKLLKYQPDCAVTPFQTSQPCRTFVMLQLPISALAVVLALFSASEAQSLLCLGSQCNTSVNATPQQDRSASNMKLLSHPQSILSRDFLDLGSLRPVDNC